MNLQRPPQASPQSPPPTTPQVSVVIPAYNVAPYLATALGSLQQQTLENFEALIVDDGSTDTTAAVAQRFVTSDRRFRLLSKANGGLSSARNYGIAQAQAPYIALLDADDAYHPDKLKTHVQHLNRDPRRGVIYSSSRIMRDDGRLSWMRLAGRPLHRDRFLALLCKNFIGHGSNGVLRRCIFEQLGGFDETLRSLEDLDFWLRIAATGQWDFYREQRTLCYYRVRPSGLSFDLPYMEQTYHQVLRTAAAQAPQRAMPMMDTALAYMYRYLARIALTARELPQAQEYLQKAWAADASIFGKDPRSFSTLLAIHLAPISQRLITGTLN